MVNRLNEVLRDMHGRRYATVNIRVRLDYAEHMEDMNNETAIWMESDNIDIRI